MTVLINTPDVKIVGGIGLQVADVHHYAYFCAIYRHCQQIVFSVVKPVFYTLQLLKTIVGFSNVEEIAVHGANTFAVTMGTEIQVVDA